MESKVFACPWCFTRWFKVRADDNSIGMHPGHIGICQRCNKPIIIGHDLEVERVTPEVFARLSKRARQIVDDALNGREKEG